MKNIIFYGMFLALLFTACKKDAINGNTEEKPSAAVTEGALISLETDFPSENQAFTFIYDTGKGNGGLKSVSGDIYVHTGVITDKSTSPSDWKYVKNSNFTQPVAATKMTAVGGGKYKFTLNPREFYAVPAGEKILKLAMVFRNADGSSVGRNSDNSDIYIPLYEADKLHVKFSNPAFEPFYTPAPAVKITMVGQELAVTAVSSKAANLTLQLNGNPLGNAANTNKISATAKITATGKQLITVTASSGAETTNASFEFIINGAVETAALPAGAKDGITFINGGRSAIFNLFAPNKQFAYLIGDFNNWQTEQTYFMKKTPDGSRWWIQVDNLDPNVEYAYQFLVDGNLRIADPYCEKVLDPQQDAGIPFITYPNLKTYPTGKTTGIVSVFKANQTAYTWRNASFTRPDKNKLVIYELHLRDFLEQGDYQTLKDTLDYLSRLGVNAIEFMPLNEFEGNSSWGYNPSFYFAVDKFYGTKNALKALIDECHGRGMAVILDMVLNHSFGQSPMVQLYFDQAAGKPSTNNPWFNTDARHPFNVGYDFNHESEATQYFSKNVLKFWMQEFKVDGFRFDLSKGFTQKNSGTTESGVGAWSAYDASRVAIWKNYNNYMKSLDANNFYVILEHFAVDLEEKELADEGMMFWNNMNHAFTEASMGFVATSDLSRAVASTHGFTQTAGLVTYMESHDEERMMYKNLQFGNTSGAYNVKDLATALKRQELAAAFLFAIPGPKMLWQFGELGYDISINQNGRTGEKPVLWTYNSNAQRKALYNRFAQFIKLKTKNDVFNTTNVQYALGGAVKSVVLNGQNNRVVVVGNFDVITRNANVEFPTTGQWKDFISGETITITGNYTKSLAPGEYHIYSTNSFIQ